MKIREIRKSKKMSGDKLSELTGIHVQTIYEYEKGKMQPSAANLDKIAKALGVTHEELYSNAQAAKSDEKTTSESSDAAFWKARALHLEQVLTDLLLEKRSTPSRPDLAKRKRVTTPALTRNLRPGYKGGYTQPRL